MPLPVPAEQYDTYVRQTCRVGQGHACCRYLLMDARGWNCGKHSSLAELLDQRVAAESIVARGDNCGGYVP